jgi:hypothetical protein
MGFEQFGVVSFTATTKAEKFVDFLRGGKSMRHNLQGLWREILSTSK